MKSSELSNESLKNMLGMSVSVIASEHFMSAGLSSPWSVAKFAISDQDKSEVWHYFWEASEASAVFSLVTAYMLKSLYPIGAAAITLAYYHKLYAHALSRTPTQNPTPVLNSHQLKINDREWKPLTEKELNELSNFLSRLNTDNNNNNNILWKEE